MALIAEYLGRDVTRIRMAPDGTVIPSVARLGFELELEKHDGHWEGIEGWQQTDDGSLRGTRVEYIFDGPASGQVVQQRLSDMADYLKTNPPAPTFRCSTHVHMDMQNTDWNVYEKTVLAYMVFEDAFFDQVDRERRHSNFCIPFMNNDWFASYFGRNIIGQTDEHHKFHYCSRWSKYSALNLNVTAVHGTIEFRGSHALTEEGDMQSLALRMLSLRLMAETHSALSHLEFVNLLAENGIGEFLPGSFKEDYVPDAGGLAAGLASALLAVTQGEIQGNEGLRRQMEVEEERRRVEREEAQRRERDRLNQIRDAARLRVNSNMEAHLAANVAASPLTTIRSLYDTARALRGMGVITTVTALAVPSRQVAAAVQLLRQNPDEARNHLTDFNVDLL